MGDNWGTQLIKGLKLVGILAGAIVAIIFIMVIGIIVVGFLLEVATTLAIGTAATAALTNVTNAYWAFIDSLISGITLVGSLVPIVIVLVVFAAVGFGIYAGAKAYKGKGKGGANY